MSTQVATAALSPTAPDTELWNPSQQRKRGIVSVPTDNVSNYASNLKPERKLAQCSRTRAIGYDFTKVVEFMG
jgi:hypothetical protein